ncbi:MAG TPA: DUF1847 domain-containing protein, partial [Bacteroidales bacterium]|nr:DUF1847 domain-containing protein [Bacteroidales bacterium]
MNCTTCSDKVCRKSQESCARESFEKAGIIDGYHAQNTSAIVQAAARLVDNGKAGTLSRVQEVIEFARLMNYQKIGIAYCYGMENDAALISQIFRESGFRIFPVSCTTGGFKQSDVNNSSTNQNVSCNPLAQSEQLNNENVDFTITMGLCLGHDILFQKNIKSYTSTLLVKDR